MEPFIGQIQLFGFNFAPQGWALCQGQLLAINQNQALFSLLGTIYGGDGRTTFALPDIRGRVPIGPGTGPGLDSISQGQRGGQQQIFLNVNNLPSHNHVANINVSTTAGEESNPQGNVIAAHAGGFNEDPSAGANLNNSLSTSNTGSNSAINIRNPYVGIYYSIALFGIFPSRS